MEFLRKHYRLILAGAGALALLVITGLAVTSFSGSAQQATPGAPSVQQQLAAAHYHLVKEGTIRSDDAGRSIRQEVWQSPGQPTVLLTDASQAEVLSIDNVSFKGRTAEYSEFWCAPSHQDSTHLDAVIDTATRLREAVSAGDGGEREGPDVPGTFIVQSQGTTLVQCFMKL